MSTLKVNTVSDLNNNSFPIENADTRMAKAWVNFDASTMTIRTAFNVSTVTDASGARFAVTFTNSLEDANFVTAGLGSFTTSNTNNGALAIRSDANLSADGAEFSIEDVDAGYTFYAITSLVFFR